jgi:GNAT superfamily N-acetyltransferase
MVVMPDRMTMSSNMRFECLTGLASNYLTRLYWGDDKLTSRNLAGALVQVVEYDTSFLQCEGIRSIAMDAFASETYPEMTVICARLGWAPQRVWLARLDGDSQPAGFLATFVTVSLAGAWIEFDLLAVRREAQGQGLAGRLMATALDAWRHSRIGRARALIREGNVASERVFARAGFTPADTSSELLIGQAAGAADGLATDGTMVRPAGVDDLTELAQRWPACFEGRSLASRLKRDNLGLLVASDASGVCGFAELLVVHTIPYGGVWLERLAALDDDESVIGALAGAARGWAAGRGLELAGAALDLSRQSARDALRRAGYQSAGAYRYFHRPIGPRHEE